LSLDYGVVGFDLSQKNRHNFISEVDLPMEAVVILKTCIKKSQLINQSCQDCIELRLYCGFDSEIELLLAGGQER
jgi:hypothetical protein